MEINKKHILLAVYFFPPYPGIGGRRWAKFAKHLAYKGYVVHVLCAKNPFNDVSLWYDDVKNNPNIIIHELPALYPSILLKFKDLSFFDKLRSRFWITLLNVVAKGTIYDKALFWKGVMTKKAEELIKKYEIKNMIASGSPFRSLLYASELKKQFPGLNVISDFRDPWTEGKSYGFAGLSEERKKYEQQMEAEVCTGSDHVIAPSGKILDYLRKKYDLKTEKTTVLPHGYDEDEFKKAMEIVPAQNSNALEIIFFGTIYEGSEEYFSALFTAVSKIKNENADLYQELKINCFSWSSNSISGQINEKGIPEKIRFSPPLKPQDLFCAIAGADYVLVVFVEKYKDYLSTKFYEILHLNKFIIYIGPEGEVSRFINENRLGLVISDMQNVYNSLVNLLSGEKKTVIYPQIKEFSYTSVTGKLEQLFV